MAKQMAEKGDSGGIHFVQGGSVAVFERGLGHGRDRVSDDGARLHQGAWDVQLLEANGCPAEELPTVVVASVSGRYSEPEANEINLPFRTHAFRSDTRKAPGWHRELRLIGSPPGAGFGQAYLDSLRPQSISPRAAAAFTR